MTMITQMRQAVPKGGGVTGPLRSITRDIKKVILSENGNKITPSLAKKLAPKILRVLRIKPADKTQVIQEIVNALLTRRGVVISEMSAAERANNLAFFHALYSFKPGAPKENSAAAKRIIEARVASTGRTTKNISKPPESKTMNQKQECPEGQHWCPKTNKCVEIGTGGAEGPRRKRLPQAAIVPDVHNPDAVEPTSEEQSEETCPICNKIRGGTGENRCTCEIEKDGTTFSNLLRAFNFQRVLTGRRASKWKGRVAGTKIDMLVVGENTAKVLQTDSVFRSPNAVFSYFQGLQQADGSVPSNFRSAPGEDGVVEAAAKIKVDWYHPYDEPVYARLLPKRAVFVDTMTKVLKKALGAAPQKGDVTVIADQLRHTMLNYETDIDYSGNWDGLMKGLAAFCKGYFAEWGGVTQTKILAALKSPAMNKLRDACLRALGMAISSYQQKRNPVYNAVKAIVKGKSPIEFLDVNGKQFTLTIKDVSKVDVDALAELLAQNKWKLKKQKKGKSLILSGKPPLPTKGKATSLPPAQKTVKTKKPPKIPKTPVVEDLMTIPRKTAVSKMVKGLGAVCKKYGINIAPSESRWSVNDRIIVQWGGSQPGNFTIDVTLDRSQYGVTPRPPVVFMAARGTTKKMKTNIGYHTKNTTSLDGAIAMMGNLTEKALQLLWQKGFVVLTTGKLDTKGKANPDKCIPMHRDLLLKYRGKK